MNWILKIIKELLIYTESMSTIYMCTHPFWYKTYWVPVEVGHLLYTGPNNNAEFYRWHNAGSAVVSIIILTLLTCLSLPSLSVSYSVSCSVSCSPVALFVPYVPGMSCSPSPSVLPPVLSDLDISCNLCTSALCAIRRYDLLLILSPDNCVPCL